LLELLKVDEVDHVLSARSARSVSGKLTRLAEPARSRFGKTQQGSGALHVDAWAFGLRLGLLSFGFRLPLFVLFDLHVRLVHSMVARKVVIPLSVVCS
jgi:hypothetical protein